MGQLSILFQITALRTAESAIKSSSGWIFLDYAETLFLVSKERVFASLEVSAPKKAKTDKSHKIEENPKWNAIAEIVTELKEEMNEFAGGEATENLLIVTKEST